MIDAFGYSALSAKELYEQLEIILLQHPELKDKPVWSPSRELLSPVDRVEFRHAGVILHLAGQG